MVNKIDRKLNMVIPIYADGTAKDAKPKAYVHSTPISSEVFDTYWEPISITFSRIYNGGFGVTSGVRIADKMLRKVSQELGVWEGATGVRAGLVTTIHQLTNVMCVGKNGWELMQLADAKAAGILDSDDAAVVEAALVYFTVASSLHRKAELGVMMGLASVLWGVQIESLNCTEFLNSLRISNIDGTTGVKTVGSLPISSVG